VRNPESATSRAALQFRLRTSIRQPTGRVHVCGEIFGRSILPFKANIPVEEQKNEKSCLHSKSQRRQAEEYKEHHRHVWPEVLDALKRNGWHNYTLFLRPDGMLFGYFEAPESFEACLAGVAKEPANLKWQEFMKPYFEALDGKRPDQA